MKKLKVKMNLVKKDLCKRGKTFLRTAFAGTCVAAAWNDVQSAMAVGTDWNGTTGKKPDTVMKTGSNIIVNMVLYAIIAVGIVVLGMGIQKCATAFTARDQESMKTGFLEVFGGIVMAGAGVFAKYFYSTVLGGQ